MRKWIDVRLFLTIVVVSIFLIIGLSACDQFVSVLPTTSEQIPIESTDLMTTQVGGSLDEITVGLVLSLSGKYAPSSDERTNWRYRNGFLMAQDEINKAQLMQPYLTFIIEDDQSTVEGAIAAYNKLIHENKVVAILGPSSSTQVEMAFPVAEENQLVAIGPSSAAEGLSALGDYVFRVNQPVDKVIPRGVRLTHERLGYQRVTLENEPEMILCDQCSLYYG